MLVNVFVDVGVDICVYEYCVLNIGVNVSLDIGMDFGIDDADSFKGAVSCCQCCCCGLDVGVEYSHNTVMVQFLQ